MMSQTGGDRSHRWFWIALAAIFLASLGLRFWGLGRFNALVFDEVYYAKFSTAFLQGRQEFGGHPPLSTYLIAGGIWLSEWLGWGNQAIRNSLTGMDLATFSYRWLNALTGSFLPLVVGAIAYQLTHRRSYALLTALFTALEGMLLVESRYALNNIYLVLFGLVGQLGLLLAAAHPQWRWSCLTLAGLGFGASVGIKWNGMGFLLGAGLVWGAAWAIQLVTLLRTGAFPKPAQDIQRSALHQLTTLHPGHIVYGLGVVPAVVYYLSWLPYINLNPVTNFWQWQASVMDYHNRVGGMDAHPYCSRWYTWPFMTRPVAYFYRTTRDGGDPTALVGLPPLPNSTETIYNVHAMGNPFLWWLSTLAMGLVVGALVSWLWGWFKQLSKLDPDYATGRSIRIGLNTNTWAALFLTVNWVANWLPWIKVTRCVFLYHYMGSAIFALMAIALLVDRWLRSPRPQLRTAGTGITVMIVASFLFWLPFFLGLPLTPWGVQIRRWFASWV